MRSGIAVERRDRRAARGPAAAMRAVVLALIVAAVGAPIVGALGTTGETLGPTNDAIACAIAPPAPALGGGAPPRGGADATDPSRLGPTIPDDPVPVLRLAHPEACTRPVRHDHGRGSLLAAALRTRSPPAPRLAS